MHKKLAELYPAFYSIPVVSIFTSAVSGIEGRWSLLQGCLFLKLENGGVQQLERMSCLT